MAISAPDSGADPLTATGAKVDAAQPLQLRGRLGKFLRVPGADGFGVAVVDDELSERTWIIRGALWGLHEGETVRVWGKAEDDPRWGRRFRVDAVQPALPAGEQALLRWLKSGRVPGVGQTVAERIVAALGPTAVAEIRDNPKSLQGISGLSAKKRQALQQAIAEIDAAEEGALFLFGLGLGPALVHKILRRFGLDAARTVRERPYWLASEIVGVGFRTADRIAQAAGLGPLDPARLTAALEHAVQELAGHGHTAPPAELVVARAAELAEVDRAPIQAAVTRAVASGTLVLVQVLHGSAEQRDRLCQRATCEAEVAVASWVAERCARSPRADQALQVAIAGADAALGFSLQGQQRQAVEQALTAPLLVVTGGPGTGKTTILKGVFGALAAIGVAPESVALAAPTGRAARRMADATGHEAKTLHRLLEYDPRQRRFLRDAQRPLQAELVVVDEASMIDVPLAAALVAALPPAARLVLVGDADQLPSVGPGAVLADLLASPMVPRVQLTHVYRQGARSQIVLAAHEVLAGRVPVSGVRGDGGDFFVIPRAAAEQIVETLVEVVRDRLPRQGFDPVRDVQVLAPVHRGPLGTEALNERLRAELNPTGAPTLRGLRVGDKLIQTRNDYDLDVFNGDIGTVVGLGATESAAAATGVQHLPLATEPTVVVQFGDREVAVRQSQLEWLELAYAVTVHKAQGSEYPAIVMPVHMGQHLMLQRNLLYTALTRARRFAVLVGQPEAVSRAVHNAAPLHRHTQLAHLLVGEGN